MARFGKRLVRVQLTGEQWFAVMAKLAGYPLSEQGRECFATGARSMGQQIAHAAGSPGDYFKASGMTSEEAAIGEALKLAEEANARIAKWPADMFGPPVAVRLSPAARRTLLRIAKSDV